MNERIKSFLHFDVSVIYLFAGVFLVAFTTLAFRYQNYTPCDDARFEYSINAYQSGRIVQFNDLTVGAKSWKWDFGDGSLISNQKNPMHVYKDKGE